MAIGGAAGTVSVYATMPFDVVKTRMQGLEAAQYKNALECGVRVFREEGALALWKGSTPRLGRVFFSSGLIFTFFENTMRVMNQFWPEPEDKKVEKKEEKKKDEAPAPAASSAEKKP